MLFSPNFFEPSSFLVFERSPHGCEDPTVARVGFMAVPDIGPWLRHGQLLITTPETLARVTETFKAFVGRLSTRGVAALAVQFGADGDTLAPELVDAAESAISRSWFFTVRVITLRRETVSRRSRPRSTPCSGPSACDGCWSTS